MERFHILHLSDLHISDSLTPTLNELIKSVCNNRELINSKVIIVVTGDIINRGNYNEYKDTAVDFFKKIKNEFDKNNINIIDVQMVPGNHDKVIDLNQKISSVAFGSDEQIPVTNEDRNKNNVYHLPTQEEMFQIFESAFSQYLKLCNEILKIFGIKQAKNSRRFKKYTKTYGAEGYKIEDTNIAFIRLNTALTSFGKPNDSEKFHLELGKNQRDVILNEYGKIKNEIDSKEEDLLTFCLAHHPSSYLKPIEAQELNKMLISSDRLNTDFYLSGHIHDGSLSNLSNHNRSMISLETGIGWPDDDAEATSPHKNHRYAIYCFDEGKNVFYSMMYKTNAANKFKPDTDYLITDQESKTGKIYNPLKTRDYAFIPLNNFSDTESQGLFVDRENINSLKMLFLKTKEFNDKCNQIINFYVYDYIDDLAKSEMSSFNYEFVIELCKKTLLETSSTKHAYADFNKELNKAVLNKNNYNEQLVQILFISFLQDIAKEFIKIFSTYFENDAECRAVFRIYQEHSDENIVNTPGGSRDSDIHEDFFEPISEYPPTTKPRKNQNTESEIKSSRSRRFRYTDSLIEYAYVNKQSMIYSINQDKNYFKPSNWDDFIVIIPQIVDYAFITEKEDEKITTVRPPLSFVFSLRIKDSTAKTSEDKSKTNYKYRYKKVSNRLLLLQFTEIEKVISDATKTFIDKFNVDMNNFIKNLSMIKEEHNKIKNKRKNKRKNK